MRSLPWTGYREPGTTSAILGLHSVVTRAWDDARDTWKRLIPQRSADIDMARLNFVSKLAPEQCYGLYYGDGPAYCTGNSTVFVGIATMEQLRQKFEPHGSAGISLLIGHEFGHHIQKILGRFRMAGQLMGSRPARAREFAMRLELEADCLAGIWIRDSATWARQPAFREQLKLAFVAIGDDTIAREFGSAMIENAAITHGTSAQRVRWFLRGADTGEIGACDAFQVEQP